MIQLKVYKTKGDSETALFLDLYETEPIKLTLSIEDITQADATSVFSKTFRVPATRHNNEFFENAYEVDGIDFDVTLKNYAEILVDGAEFREGHIRLQKIFRNQDLDKIDYELLFLGETRDFSSIIAEKTLCQLVMTDFDWEGLPNAYTNADDFSGPFTYTNIVTSWLAFPQTANLTAGYADGDIIMPLIDHGNTYTNAQSNQAGDPDQARIALGPTGAGSRSFTHPINSLSQTRMKPMIRAKRVLDQIFEDVGYTYSSEFLNSDRFHQMYISAFGNDESIGMEIDQVTGTNFQSSNQFGSGNDINEYMYNNLVTTNVANNFVIASPATGSYFNVTADAAIGGNFYIMSASAAMNGEVEQSNGPNIQVPVYLRLCVVNQIGGNITQTLALGNSAGNGSTSSLTWDSRNGGYQPIAGDIIQVFCDTSSGFIDYSTVTNTYWDCTAAPGAYYSPLDLDCEHKQIDYVKDILTMFRLVMQPDNNRPNNFIIEPWQEFIGSGVTYDWSHKLVEDKDTILEPLFNTQSATIEFSKVEDEDFINQFHQDNNKHAYGYLQFNSANELLKGTRKIEVKGIAPTPLDQITSSSPGYATIPQWVIPQVFTTDDGDAIEYVPIKPKTRILFYNGKETATNVIWYLNDDSGNEQPQTDWPLVSPYENWPVQQASLNLNFSNDTRYYINPSPGGGYYNQGTTLFDGFWSRYISSLYNKFSRRLTAKFILNNVDLQDLTFDDVIFIDGKYYRPEKIIDAQVGAETVVTCQLITLNDQRPIWLEEPLNGFSVAVSNTNCIGEQGDIQITTNGTPAFTWELDSSGAQGNVNPSGSAPFTFSISAPVGIDTLTVTDSLGRTAVVQVDVPASTSLPVTSTFTQVDPTDCTAPCNGSIDVTPFGGSGAPYTVTWSDGVVSEDRTNICPNTYTYVVEDSNGCQSDTYTVTLTCATVLYNYILREFLDNCTRVSSATYIASSTTQLPINQVCTFNQIQGCFYIEATTQNPAQYTIDAINTDCASCSGGPTPISWKVQSCTYPTPDPINHPNATRYVTLDPANQGSCGYAAPPGQLVPGMVVSDGTFTDIYGPCYTVIAQDSVEQGNLCYDAIYNDCTECQNVPVNFGYYAFACDNTSFPPTYFQSSGLAAQLAVGGTHKISTGTYTGICVQIISLQQTPSGEFLDPTPYTDCDDCQGITPTVQACHEITNTGLGTAFGSYTYNGLGYSWTVNSGNVSSICAEVGSVTVVQGTATIYNTTNVCTSPKQCTLPPPAPDTYVIESCIPAMGNWTLERGLSSFSLGDVVQFRLTGGAAVYCGTIITLNNGTPDAILHNEISSYACGDSIHCLQ